MKLFLIVGTRPQIIKSAPIIQEAIERSDLLLDIIHTGQHYDYEMSRIFFNQLDLPEPTVNLNVGSGSHTYQTGVIITRLEDVLSRENPDVIIVPGDTNSALAAAIAAVKLGYPVAHVEAGARCYDMRMAEEINRRLIDHCSSLLFAVSKNCEKNLVGEAVPGKTCLSGDTMYDMYLSQLDEAHSCQIVDNLDLRGEEYVVLTLHRAETLDMPNKLEEIFNTVLGMEDLDIVLPVHPRLKARMDQFGPEFESPNLLKIEPVGYIDMLSLLLNAKLVLTDSGGLQKEAFWSKVPCITLRETTEWIETVEHGVNILAGTSKAAILRAYKRVLRNYDEIRDSLRIIKNPYGDGKAARRVLDTTSESQ